MSHTDDAKKKRLGEALRANLRRRKAQARSGDAAPEADERESSPQDAQKD